MNISRRQFLEAAALGCATMGSVVGQSLGASSKFLQGYSAELA